MKICPTCRKTYQDDGLNFCLEDGSVLTVASNDAPPTVMMQAPPPTNPNTVGSNQPGIQTSWDQQAQYSLQPQKKSKTWLWVVGILGLGILLCGGGLVGFLGFVAYNTPTNIATNTANNSRGSNSSNSFGSNSRTSNSDAPPTNDGRTKLDTVDFEGWVQENSPYGNTAFTNNELVMSAKRKGYYYVLVGMRDYITENANTRLTVRNVDNADSSMGYGLVFHSSPVPLQQGYAFLIDSKKKRYRVVRHVPQDEPVVVKWTNSDAIKEGSEANVLEARDNAGSVDLYINDQKVTSIRNAYGYKEGVAGVYSGDGVRAGFSKLEIRRQ